MKYLPGKIISVIEVPDEISLIISITGCTKKCPGCHSPELQENSGVVLTEEILLELIQYRHISCVCFFGGDQDVSELEIFLNIIKNFGLKTCLYSGMSTMHHLQNILDRGLLDYLKIGPYIQNLGGLADKTTNQRFFRINSNSFQLLNHKFQR